MKRKIWLFVGICLVLAAFKACGASTSTGNTAAAVQDFGAEIGIIQRTDTHNTTWRPMRKIEYIVVHYTAGLTSAEGSAQGTASYFATSNENASADFIVDYGGIVQYNPDISNRYCWAVGGEQYNNLGGSLYGVATNANSVSIEICSTNQTGQMTQANDPNYFFAEEVLEQAVVLTKYLMEQLDIDVAHVIRHYDVTGKPCPGIIGWNAESGDESAWEAFQSRISADSVAE